MNRLYKPILLMLLLAGCAKTEVIECPETIGWTYEERLQLAHEFKEMSKRFPLTGAALTEYSDMVPNKCAYLSGLRDYGN